MPSTLRVGVLGAGAWARFAHLPGWLRDPRCEVVGICDVELERAETYASEFGIPYATDDWQALLSRADLDVVDIVTPSQTHYELAEAALEAGKHVLCEKPVAYDFRQTRHAAGLARSRGLKTKLGFTFRYSPGVQYARALLDDGFVGTPFIFNGYEQNSQWLDPQVPLRQVDPEADQGVLQTSSIGEYANGAIGSIQTSFVTVGNYPGVEARIYGERGAIICRLVEERGVAETISLARADAVEFEQVEIPSRFYPRGGHPRESWRSLFYANLIKDFVDEIEAGGERNQGNFEDGAWVQEVINAVELSYRQRRWVDLPLPVPEAEFVMSP